MVVVGGSRKRSYTRMSRPAGVFHTRGCTDSKPASPTEKKYPTPSTARIGDATEDPAR